MLLVMPLGAPAYAEDTTVPPYVRIISNDTYLYATASNTKPLFALEHTYYAEVKGVEDRYYRVEISDNVGMFNKIIGYVLISKVEAVNQIPLSPLYPSVTVSVTGHSAKLHLHPDENSAVLIRATISQTMAYYGSIVVGGINWYYVNCGDYMGYVNNVNVSKAAVPAHPTPLTNPNVDPDPIVDPDPGGEPDLEPDPLNNSFDGVQLALILLITIPSVVIVVMLFSPHGKKSPVREKSNFKSAATATKTSEDKRPKPRYFDDYL